ncbi:flagellar assembly protein FliH [uncultured Desulfuromusa sp.]|uniref:FliH/SctL family protein n=1 Tax=uncultured Desulfuromusa sp. TaxID=219183 RepID=UPI002AA8E8F2|nr:flagellar assembly protein FliH [uncultured Desulfuromusa sp.]
MNLSKIYRGTEANGLKEFQFRSFGETEPNSPLESEAFVKNPKAAVPPTPVGHSAKELEAAYNRGRQEGLENAENNLESAAQAFVAATTEIKRLRESVSKNSGKDMLRLVMAISEQVIRREVAADPKILLTMIENALQSSVRSDQYRIRINPADLESVTLQKPLFLASISGLKNLSIETDPEITPGGCRVDSDFGDIDATLETQLETIRQTLSKAISDAE